MVSSIQEPSFIYIFKGEGSSYQGVDKVGVDNLKRLLLASFPNSQIQLVDNQGMSPDQWNPEKSLVVLPGGKCSDWTWVNAETVEKTRKFVQEGGRIYATCAGAYCLCEESVFELSNGLVLNRKRGFNFFSGKGVGPLLKSPLPALDFPVAEAVKIRLEGGQSDKSGYALLSGGGYFEPKERPTYPYEVLASYVAQPKEKSLAAVEVRVNKGRVWLTFPHFENSMEDYPLEGLNACYANLTSQWSRTYKKLDKGESFRKEVMETLMRRIAQGGHGTPNWHPDSFPLYQE